MHFCPTGSTKSITIIIGGRSVLLPSDADAAQTQTAREQDSLSVDLGESMQHGGTSLGQEDPHAGIQKRHKKILHRRKPLVSESAENV